MRNSRIDEVSIDGKVGYLDGELHEDMVGEIFGLLLQILVRFYNESGNNRGEQTGLWMH